MADFTPTPGIYGGIKRLVHKRLVHKRHLAALLAASLLSACSTSSGGQTGAYVMDEDAKQRVRERLSQSAQPYESASMLDMADKLAAEGSYEAAISLYRSAGGSDRQRLGLARALTLYGKPAAALTLTEGSQDPEMLTIRGNAALAMGDFQTSLQAFGEAVSLGGSNRARAGYGIALAVDGQIGRSLDVLEATTGDAAEANRALILIVSGQAESGTRILEDMIRRGSAGVRERQNLALGYLIMGRDADALAMASLDLDRQTAVETVGFYRQVQALDVPTRMRVLVLGVISPEWTRRDSGNLLVENTEEAADASLRMVEKPIEIAAAEPEPEPEPVEPEPEPEPEPEKEVLPANAPPPLEPEGWAVQIAAYRKIEELIAGWEILRAANMDILEFIPPRRSEVDFGDRLEKPDGFFYRLNAGPLETLAEARELCETLTERGTACWVRPPEVTEGKLPSGDEAKARNFPRGMAIDNPASEGLSGGLSADELAAEAPLKAAADSTADKPAEKPSDKPSEKPAGVKVTKPKAKDDSPKPADEGEGSDTGEGADDTDDSSDA